MVSNEDIYDVARLIPSGKVTSYGAIARYLGSTRGARLVGWAMNKSFDQQPNVPAHRVVNRNGLLTGAIHFPPDYSMAERLQAEGVEVSEGAVVNFEAHLWDPNRELI